jgi:hypothetical protein
MPHGSPLSSKTFESTTPARPLANAMHKRHSLSKTCALFSIPPKGTPDKAFDLPREASKQPSDGIRIHAGTKLPVPGLWYLEVVMLRQSMVRWFRMALLGAAVSLAFGTMASAQSWGYGDDHYYDRHATASNSRTTIGKIRAASSTGWETSTTISVPTARVTSADIAKPTTTMAIATVIATTTAGVIAITGASKPVTFE